MSFFLIQSKPRFLVIKFAYYGVWAYIWFQIIWFLWEGSAAFLLSFIGRLSTHIRLTKHGFEKGEKHLFDKKLKKVEVFSKSDFPKLELRQADSRFFKIYAVSKEKQDLLLFKLPNKELAQAKMDFIREKIGEYW